jgi:hypothetical protein
VLVFNIFLSKFGQCPVIRYGFPNGRITMPTWRERRPISAIGQARSSSHLSRRNSLISQVPENGHVTLFENRYCFKHFDDLDDHTRCSDLRFDRPSSPKVARITGTYPEIAMSSAELGVKSLEFGDRRLEDEFMIIRGPSAVKEYLCLVRHKSVRTYGGVFPSLL